MRHDNARHDERRRRDTEHDERRGFIGLREVEGEEDEKLEERRVERGIYMSTIMRDRFTYIHKISISPSEITKHEYPSFQY